VAPARAAPQSAPPSTRSRASALAVHRERVEQGQQRAADRLRARLWHAADAHAAESLGRRHRHGRWAQAGARCPQRVDQHRHRVRLPLLAQGAHQGGAHRVVTLQRQAAHGDPGPARDAPQREGRLGPHPSGLVFEEALHQAHPARLPQARERPGRPGAGGRVRGGGEDAERVGRQAQRLDLGDDRGVGRRERPGRAAEGQGEQGREQVGAAEHGIVLPVAAC
jgi:hypothetical protein